MKLRIKSSLYPAIVRGVNNDTLVGGTIYEVNGKPWKHTYVRVEGHITHGDIDWLPGVTIEKKETKEWKVKSSKVGKFYTVRQLADGRRTCDCDGFHYRRQCRHIKEVQ